jgi:TPR repeat protein
MFARHGVDGPPDVARAQQLLARGCELGDAPACNALGALVGKKIVVGAADAATYYRKACDQDLLGACSNLASLQVRPRGPDDKRRAALVELDQECNLLGGMDACVVLGIAADDDGEPYRAIVFYDKACAHGVDSACYALGYAFLRGRGTSADSNKAAGLFRLACNLGHAQACAGLATLCAQGEGCAKSDAMALKLYQTACDGGFANGCLGAGVLLLRAAPRKAAEAAVWFERGCTAGNADACVTLAGQVERGDGVAKDSSRAADLRAQACKLGNKPACQAPP